ncbi:tRNA (guanosine(46)-N7)-methyltransferase TrmB [Persicitalea jodogahamensis]|uniref:tRNA (guanine-N(7)-)-methyltransferase n=1 Tax=Persicitalea jodogahamensis TaxID=402147 RepID=A0A8J3DC61_9BACT|nr:tRNA (guanosine(46)-N7)-methyltransferase TrmB [Persicitalea jodogahamensis]GHB82219.1 tRNA (guanine-N(7)-)-methyltransferase [Persicitalea jodogahamensis]
MSRNKLDKYQYSREAENVIERGKPLYTTIKGKWNEVYFGNTNPITLELACGKGEYTIGLAQKFPDRNFIGVDIKGDRLARGSKIASGLKLTNVAFLRTSIQYMDEFFVENEIDEIWLVHPDPQLRDRDEKKRLTNTSFLEKYEYYLKPKGLFHLKTDSFPLYEYSLGTIDEMNFEIVSQTSNLYQSDLLAHHHGISTHYERAFVSKGFDINYIRAINKKGASI